MLTPTHYPMDTREMPPPSRYQFPADGDPRDYVEDLRSRLAQYKVLSSELADEAGMHRSAMSRFFNSDHVPNLDTVMRLEQALARILHRRAAEDLAERRKKRKK